MVKLKLNKIKYDEMRSHSMCLKVRHFWHRCLKCLKWGIKWGTKLEIFWIYIGSLVKSPQSVVISDIHHNHHNHHTLWWFIWGLHLIHLSAPQLSSLTNLNPQSSVLNPHCATKVWHIYTCATCATNVAQVWHTKEGSHVFWNKVFIKYCSIWTWLSMLYS